MSYRETQADDIDCDLYRLMARIENARDKESRAMYRDPWNHALDKLRSARVHIRSLMSQADRERTS